MAQFPSSAAHADRVVASEISVPDQLTILSIGEKIHIIHRQLFDGDTRRHFVGTVEACDGSLARVKGYLFALDPKANEFVKYDPEPRTHIVALAADALIINVLPPQVDIAKITYKHNPRAGHGIWVTDGSDWHLGLSHM